jgi:hypothetical protein
MGYQLTSMGIPMSQQNEVMRSNRREVLTLLAGTAPVALGALSALAAARTAHAQTTKPNILFMLVDNLGYGNWVATAAA